MTCKDIEKFDNQGLLPSAQLEGRREEFSLWETVVFSGKLDSNNDEVKRVMKKAVMEKIEGMKDIQYIDVYIITALPTSTSVAIEHLTTFASYPSL